MATARQPIPNLESPDNLDDTYDFAYYVVREVYPYITGEEILAPINEQFNPTFKFTKEHKEDIQDFLRENGRELKKLVAESRNEKGWRYDDENYLTLKNKVIQDYKPEVYSEKEFVRLCAALAIVAIGNQTLKENYTIEDQAANELSEYMERAIKPGSTIQNASWAEN